MNFGSGAVNFGGGAVNFGGGAVNFCGGALNSSGSAVNFSPCFLLLLLVLGEGVSGELCCRCFFSFCSIFVVLY